MAIAVARPWRQKTLLRHCYLAWLKFCELSKANAETSSIPPSFAVNVIYRRWVAIYISVIIHTIRVGNYTYASVQHVFLCLRHFYY
jgi:hypothetical protein